VRVPSTKPGALEAVQEWFTLSGGPQHVVCRPAELPQDLVLAGCTQNILGHPPRVCDTTTSAQDSGSSPGQRTCPLSPLSPAACMWTSPTVQSARLIDDGPVDCADHVAGTLTTEASIANAQAHRSHHRDVNIAASMQSHCYGCGSRGGTSCGGGDGVVGVAGFVEAVAQACQGPWRRSGSTNSAMLRRSPRCNCQPHS
jgi:hypothetical protein